MQKQGTKINTPPLNTKLKKPTHTNKKNTAHTTHHESISSEAETSIYGYFGVQICY